MGKHSTTNNSIFVIEIEHHEIYDLKWCSRRGRQTQNWEKAIAFYFQPLNIQQGGIENLFRSIHKKVFIDLEEMDVAPFVK